MALLIGWLWRIFLIGTLFWRISRLDLALVPTHPDRVGGLGFIQGLPAAFSLVTLALWAVIAAQWVHDSVYHGQALGALKLHAAVFVIVWSAMLLAPLPLFMPRLMAMKRCALRE